MRCRTMTMKVERRVASELRCACCHGPIVARGGWTCPRCCSRVHTACTAEIRECPTLGCGPVGDEQRRSLDRRRSEASWLTLKRVVRALFLITFWLTASGFLDETRRTCRPHSCGWHGTIPEIREWESYLAVAMVMIGSYLLWRLRRDVYA